MTQFLYKYYARTNIILKHTTIFPYCIRAQGSTYLKFNTKSIFDNSNVIRYSLNEQNDPINKLITTIDPLLKNTCDGFDVREIEIDNKRYFYMYSHGLVPHHHIEYCRNIFNDDIAHNIELIQTTNKNNNENENENENKDQNKIHDQNKIQDQNDNKNQNKNQNKNKNQNNNQNQNINQNHNKNLNNEQNQNRNRNKNQNKNQNDELKKTKVRTNINKIVFVDNENSNNQLMQVISGTNKRIEGLDKNKKDDILNKLQMELNKNNEQYKFNLVIH